MVNPLAPLRRSRGFNPIWLVLLAVIGVSLLTGLSLLRYSAVDIGPRWGLRGASIIPALVYTAMGCLILARHPRHPIGLLLLGVGISSGLQGALEEYAIYGLLIDPGWLPGALFAAWLINWSWILVIGPITSLLPLLYPTGQLLSPRWRWVAVMNLVGLGLMGAGFGLTPGRFGSVLTIFENPYGLSAFGDRSAEVAIGIVGVGSLLYLVGGFLSVLSVLWRLRRAQGVQRQQLKWFVYAAAVAGLLVPVNFTDLPALHVLYLVCATMLPVAIGLAVLRYRLYDIDLIVNRTLVYGALTAILAGVYLGSVVLLESLLSTLTGERRSALVTVVSTLGIAALFTPLRRQVQAFIDRRFYRRKYDAARTLAGFSATARDDVDLHTLNERLLAVVTDTMQPAHVGLWVRGQEAGPDAAAAVTLG